MGSYYIFRVQGSEDEGMKFPQGLYTAIISTADKFAGAGAFPHLLAHNKYSNRFINDDQIESFKQELDQAGSIILTNPLIQYSEDNENYRMELHENIFTPTRAAIAIATAMELCDICIKRNKGIKINIETGNTNHFNLSLEKRLSDREYSWVYPLEATSVMDYIKK
ncbi:MAG: hypothetical protein ACP5OA_06005 [Candidatus Woesearchaeota archaeon]